MPEVTHAQTNFTAGEFSPRLFGRSDFSRYQNGAATIENYLIQVHGGLTRRSGTKHVVGARDPAKMGRLVSFQFSNTQHYILELADNCIRFYRNQSVLNKSENITTGTSWSGGVATVTIAGGHQWKAGAVVTIADVNPVGYNQVDAVLTAVGHNSIQYAVPVNPTAWVSGGTVTGQYEIDSPWPIADVFKVNVEQSADILYLGCTGHKPYLLERLGDTFWQLAELQWAEQATTHRNSTESLTMSPGATTGTAVVVTASSSFFNANHIGNWIRVWHGGAASGTWGWGRIKAQGGTTATVEVTRSSGSNTIGKAFAFANAPSKFWRIFDMNSLEGPYDEVIADEQWTIDSDKAGTAVDDDHTLTATQDTFVASDVGRAITLKRTSQSKWGTFVITEFKNTKEVAAWLTNEPGGSGDWVPQREWRLGAWSDTHGWPQIPVFHQNRLWWGRSDKSSYSQSFWASVVGRFENYRPYDPLTNGTVTASDGLSYTIAHNQVNTIRWMQSTSRGISIGTTGGVFLGSASTPATAVTPTDFSAHPHLAWGAQDDNFPIQTGAGNVLYPQIGGLVVREVLYSFERDQLIARPISRLAEHVTVGGLVRQTAYTQQPNSLAWFIRSDGQLISLTYEPLEEVVGWSRHILGGSLAGESNPVVESVAVVHNTPNDELWMIVRRTVDGATKRYVEYMTAERAANDRQDDSFYVDSGITKFDSKAITGATDVNPVVITATGHGFSNGDKVRIRDVKGMAEINDISFKIAEVQTNSFELATINGLVVTAATQANPGQITMPGHGLTTGDEVHFHDIGGMTQLNGNGYTVTVVDADNITIGVDTSSGYSAYTSGGTGHLATNGTGHTAYVSGGTATKEITAITGAGHLEGELVSILADGSVHPPQTVSSGAFSLDSNRASSKIQYGLGYTSKVRTLPLITPGGSVTRDPRGRIKIPRKAVVRFDQTIGGKIGSDEAQLDIIEFRDDELMGSPPGMFSGLKVFAGLRGNFGRDAQVTIQQDDPLPMTVVALDIVLGVHGT